MSRRSERKKKESRLRKRVRRTASHAVPGGTEATPAAALTNDAAAVVVEAAAVVESAAAVVQELDDDVDHGRAATAEVLEHAAAVVEDAAAVVSDAAAIVHDSAFASRRADAPEVTGAEEAAVHHAIDTVQEAVAAVSQAAAAVHDTAAAVEASWQGAERRRGPRHDRTVEVRTDWKHIALYLPLVALVVIVGFFAIWSFVQQQTVASVAAAPLPRVTLLTDAPDAPHVASWIRLLESAELSPTVVPLKSFQKSEGVVLLCGVANLPPNVAAHLQRHVSGGGSVVIAGTPPRTPIGPMSFPGGTSTVGGMLKFAEAATPILARVNPGHELAVRPTPVAAIREDQRMVVDARWENARPAIAHMQQGFGRYVWFGFEPDALVNPSDNQLLLMLRAAFRWAALQPVSDGAVGEEASDILTPEGRRRARDEGLSFSVDRLSNRRYLAVRVVNRAGRRLERPMVKIWLHPRVEEVVLSGDYLMRRGVTLTADPEDNAWVVSLSALRRNEERVVKLKITDTRPAPGEGANNAAR